MSESEGSTDQYVTVEAPTHIEVGQNFYDQPPFNLVLAHVALTKGLNVEQTKVLLSALAKYSYEPAIAEELDRNNGSGAFYAERAIAELGLSLGLERVNVQGRQIPHREATQSATFLLQELAPFPWWFTYVTENVGEQFLKDGSWKGKGMNPEPIDSYAIWIRKRLQRNKSAVLGGIADVFRQDFRTTSTSLVVSRELVSRGVTSLATLRK